MAELLDHDHGPSRDAAAPVGEEHRSIPTHYDAFRPIEIVAERPTLGEINADRLH